MKRLFLAASAVISAAMLAGCSAADSGGVGGVIDELFGSEAVVMNVSRSSEGYDELLWPVGGEDGGEISQMIYGCGGEEGHSGIDIAAPAGTQVFAADTGVVAKTGTSERYGSYLRIDHGNGMTTLYAFLESISVSEGDEVSSGDAIAEIGSEGCQSASALHFEVYLDNECVDPVNFLPWHKRASYCVEY